jgi:hypothetical protein
MSQYLRKCTLLVANDTEALDLSELRITFQVQQSDVETPNSALIRVYNLAPETLTRVENEFTRVILQAGYENDSFGIIFEGSIKQTRRGRFIGPDSFLDILAADGDEAYNQATVNETLAAGTTSDQVLQRLAAAMGLPVGYAPDLPPNALQRGKAMYGLARWYLRDFAQTYQLRWSIQRGQLVLVPMTGYVPGQAVVLNKFTGLIGVPEVTPGGICVRALLNPQIRVGSLIQLNSNDITGALLGGNLLYTPGRLESLPGLLPKVINDDGFYRVLVSEYVGDTRGEPWYSELTCLAIDKTAPADQAAKAEG